MVLNWTILSAAVELDRMAWLNYILYFYTFYNFERTFPSMSNQKFQLEVSRPGQVIVKQKNCFTSTFPGRNCKQQDNLQSLTMETRVQSTYQKN